MCGERTVELKISSPPPAKSSVNDDNDNSSLHEFKCKARYISVMHKMSVTGMTKLGLSYSLKQQNKTCSTAVVECMSIYVYERIPVVANL